MIKTLVRNGIVAGILTLLSFATGLAGVDEVPKEKSEKALYHESHALLVGVSQYSQGWPQLSGVHNDIKQVGEALQGHGFNVVTVMDPTRKEMEEAFNNFINEYGQHPENRLLIYYAGHGYTMKLAYGGDMGYIIPSDTPRPAKDKSGFLKTAMDMQLVEVFAKRIQAKHALFMFDSCFSGSIFSMSRGIPEHITFKVNQPVRQFITAGGADEKVPDESIFSDQFIEALNGTADFDQDGYLTGTELGEFLHNRVMNYSKGSQHPQYGKIRDPHLDKGDFIFLHTSSPAHLADARFNPNQISPATSSMTLEEIHALLEEIPETRGDDELMEERQRLFENKMKNLGKLNRRQMLASTSPAIQPEACRMECEAIHQGHFDRDYQQCLQLSGTFKLKHEPQMGRFNECMSFDRSPKAHRELRTCLAQCPEGH